MICYCCVSGTTQMDAFTVNRDNAYVYTIIILYTCKWTWKFVGTPSTVYIHTAMRRDTSVDLIARTSRVNEHGGFLPREESHYNRLGARTRDRLFKHPVSGESLTWPVSPAWPAALVVVVVNCHSASYHTEHESPSLTIARSTAFDFRIST